MGTYAEKAQDLYDEKIKEKGCSLKIYEDDGLAKYITKKIRDENYSPEAVLLEIQRKNLKFNVEIKSVNTIYSYIRKGVFQDLTLENLPVLKNKKKRKQKVHRAGRVPRGKSIEDRPEHVLDREEFGHWEMDTVVGQKKNQKNLLVLTERKTRDELIRLQYSRKAEEVAATLQKLRQEFGANFHHIFKSITMDNGSEFLEIDALIDAVQSEDGGTELYYCHPYRACERGSNENQNRFVRRWYPKGTDFDKMLNKEDVQALEDWINNYPRRMFGGKTAGMLFAQQCERLKAG